jgi:hypothetical protein
MIAWSSPHLALCLGRLCLANRDGAHEEFLDFAPVLFQK